MADFRKWIIALAVLALFAGLAGAQTINPYQCTASASVTPQLRSEGLTELVGDILLTCSGGQPLALGSLIPTANITVYMNGTVTSRLLGTASVSNASEALVLLDDPGNGGTAYGNTLPQILCGGAGAATVSGGAAPLLGAGSGGCTQYVGNVGANPSVPVNGVGGTTPGANVFQGVVSGGSVTFYGVPVLPPNTSGGTHSFRITNIRLNANGVTGGGPIPANAVAAIAISGSTAIPITNSSLTVGYITQSLSTKVNKAFSSSGSTATSITQLQCTSVPASGSTPVALDTLRYSELIGTGFKTRGTTSQNVPGSIYNTESGFTLTSLSSTSSATGAIYTAGYADWGTRVKAVFNNIPSGVSVYVSTTNLSSALTGPMNGNSQVPPVGSSYAQLIVSETAPDSGTIPPLITQTGTSSGVGYAPLTNVGGSATAVWEVTSSLPNTPENLDFAVFITYTSNTGSSSPALGTMTVNMSYAPTPPSFTLASGSVASATLGIPRFADTSTGTNALTIAICQTALLYPYVINTNGFDTGLAIANTTTDPFGTTPQAGACRIYWYGSTPPTVNPGFLGSAGYQTTAPTSAQLVATGTIQAWGASVVAPGFSGYVIAVCDFQYAHGFAFVSDLGARNLAMGYLADIIGGTIGTGRASPVPVEVSGQ